jgi:tetratricopeptide (TPR) repeat protein
MKGLVLTHMGRRDEGVDLVKKGVRLDLTSHICWHVFGLIQKADKNYEEALKSYTQALKFDKVRQSVRCSMICYHRFSGKHESVARFCAAADTTSVI